MYTWEVEFEENWSYDDKGEYEIHDEGLFVVAKTAEEAIEKVKEVILKKTSKVDGEVYNVINVRLVRVERMEKLVA